MRNLPLVATVVALAVVGMARPAEARSVRFLGAHPIAAKLGGGYCYIEAPHMHIYAPDHAALYQQVNDEYVFTGDPTPFGYEGEKHQYYGHHPVVSVNGEPVYCYIDGPHTHPFAAPSTPEYKVKGDVAFYIGPFDPGYNRLRPHRVKAVNAEYRPYVAFRPTVEVAPPPEWHGEVWVAPPAVTVQAPGVVVNAPGAYVGSPGVVVGAPGVVVSSPGVVVNSPGVVVHGPRFIAPPPPSVRVNAPGVYVGAPGVYVGGPGVTVGGGVYVEGGHHEGHHDNGKHNGWGKHGRGR